jgi:RNA polymerase sigma factor (sigma-70 family)
MNMEHLVPADRDRPSRLTDDQAEQLVLRTVATQAESLLRTAYRHSLCDDDAHDAYQRGLEIFVRRAPQLDPHSADRWLHVVIKREAWAVREARSDLLNLNDFDADDHEAIHLASPEEQTISAERMTLAAEALQRLKPQELQAMWLKASGASYDEIAEATGSSWRAVSRRLLEGRKRFLERFAGIEAGEECDRWADVLSAIVDGEASAEQMADVRPHLRNCSACRATLRALHEADRPFAAVLPLGLAGLGAKYGGLFERVLSMGGSNEAPAAAGGLTLFGAGGAKLVGVLAAGAVATAGGVVVHERHVAHAHRGASGVAHRRGVRQPVRKPVAVNAAIAVGTAARAASSGGAPRAGASAHHTATTHRVRARRSVTHPGRIEFSPGGSEPAAAPPSPPATAAATSTSSSKASTQTAPAAPKPVAVSTADSSKGEFAPQP